jgi:DNA polymerase-3 subunit alpha
LNHPLEYFNEEIKALGLISISQFNGVRDGEVVIIGGLMNSKKIKKDKKGRNYAIVNIEDFEGSIDTFVFADCFEKYAAHLKQDMPLIIKGRISGDEDRRSLRADIVMPFSDARKFYKKLFISIGSDQLNDDILHKLHELINNNQGECEVWFRVNGKEDARRFRSRSLRINPDSLVIEKIKAISSQISIKIYGQL